VTWAFSSLFISIPRRGYHTKSGMSLQVTAEPFEREELWERRDIPPPRGRECPKTQQSYSVVVLGCGLRPRCALCASVVRFLTLGQPEEHVLERLLPAALGELAAQIRDSAIEQLAAAVDDEHAAAQVLDQ